MNLQTIESGAATYSSFDAELKKREKQLSFKIQLQNRVMELMGYFPDTSRMTEADKVVAENKAYESWIMEGKNVLFRELFDEVYLNSEDLNFEQLAKGIAEKMKTDVH